MFDVCNWDFDGYCAEQLERFWALPNDLASLAIRVEPDRPATRGPTP
jgi:hypothetical protein